MVIYPNLNKLYNLSKSMVATFIICTYNGCKTIISCLEALIHQTTSLEYEVIVIDNNSNDSTFSLVENWIFKNKYANVSIFKVTKRGKVHALRCGINKSLGEIVIICDDDNFLNEDYLEIAYKLLKENNKIGLAAGYNTAVTDILLPEWFQEKQVLFGCGALSNHPGLVEMVWGAGMVCRGDLIRGIYSSRIEHIMEGFDDKKGNRIMGEDNELCFWVKYLGYTLVYSDELKLKHFMLKERLTVDYLNQLEQSIIIGNDRFKKMREIFYHLNRQIAFSDVKYLFTNSNKGIAIRTKMCVGNKIGHSILNNYRELIRIGQQLGG
jgi:glycosyltransferase involved in cell wall biosynthesis